MLQCKTSLSAYKNKKRNFTALETQLEKKCDSEEFSLLSNIEYENQRLLTLIHKGNVLLIKMEYRTVKLGVNIYFS